MSEKWSQTDLRLAATICRDIITLTDKWRTARPIETPEYTMARLRGAVLNLADCFGEIGTKSTQLQSDIHEIIEKYKTF